jgi:hypothetical protein
MQEQQPEALFWEPSKIAYGIVVRTTLESLPALKRDLEKCFERHEVSLIYQQASIGFLRIVEEPWPPKGGAKL